jgi:hypothetical protein
VQQYPDADAQLKTHTPRGEGAQWAALVNAAEGNGASYFKALHGKPHFSDLWGTYTITLHELKAMLKASSLGDQTNSPNATGQQTTQEHGFQEVRRRKRRATDEPDRTSKRAAVKNNTSPALNIHTRSSSPETFSPHSRQRTWTPTLPVLRPLPMRRQFLAKEVGRFQ